MDKQFIKWFTQLIVAADIVLLLASTPHIAAWFEHNDNPHTWLESAYAWVIGYGIALAIDGTALALLYGLIGLFQSKVKASGKKSGLIAGLVFLALLSVYVNWQYDIQNATTAFAKADAVQVFGMPLGNLNPFIGGSFALLTIFYAILSSIVQSDVKVEVTDEEYATEKRRLQREQDLKELRKSARSGLFQQGKEAIMGRERDSQELLNEAINFLRNARELRAKESHEQALQALSAHLNIRAKTTLPLLIQARNILATEEQEASMNTSTSDHEESKGSTSSDLDQMEGRATVSIEDAASMLDCQVKRVLALRNQGKLKHAPKRDNLITVASLRAYMATRRKRRASPRERDTDGNKPALHIVNE